MARHFIVGPTVNFLCFGPLEPQAGRRGGPVLKLALRSVSIQTVYRQSARQIHIWIIELEIRQSKTNLKFTFNIF